MKLVLLHPLPLDGTAFSSDFWALADECHAPSLYRLGDDLGSWAAAVLDLVGDGPVVVVGNSVGGSCAIEMAHRAPGKVKALVLSGAKPGHRPEPEFRDQALRVIEEEGLGAAWDRYWAPLLGRRADAAVIEQAWRIAEAQGPEALSTGVRVFHGRPDRSDVLASRRGPTWIVSGEYDIHPERAKKLAAGLPNATYREVKGSGHYVPIERPRALLTVAADALQRAESDLV